MTDDRLNRSSVATLVRSAHRLAAQMLLQNDIDFCDCLTSFDNIIFFLLDVINPFMPNGFFYNYSLD